MTDEPDYDTRLLNAFESIAKSLQILAAKPPVGFTLELRDDKKAETPAKWADPEKMLNDLASAEKI